MKTVVGTPDPSDQTPQEPNLAENLSVFELCDRCPARASAVVVLPSGRGLTFCTHHVNRFEPALAAVGAHIYRKEAE